MSSPTTNLNKNSVRDQKVIASELLERLKCLDPYVFIAGGAPRNWELGIPAKDFDVYIECVSLDKTPINKKVDAINKFEMWKTLGFEKKFENLDKLQGLNNKSAYINSGEIRQKCIAGVFGTIFEGIDVDMIFFSRSNFNGDVRFKHPYKFITENHFDCSLCAASYFDGKIHTSPEFDFSIEHKVNVYARDCVLQKTKHYEKLSQYFPDFVHLHVNDLPKYFEECLGEKYKDSIFNPSTEKGGIFWDLDSI